jgi:hypothetical protein
MSTQSIQCIALMRCTLWTEGSTRLSPQATPSSPVLRPYHVQYMHLNSTLPDTQILYVHSRLRLLRPAARQGLPHKDWRIGPMRNGYKPATPLRLPARRRSPEASTSMTSEACSCSCIAILKLTGCTPCPLGPHNHHTSSISNESFKEPAPLRSWVMQRICGAVTPPTSNPIHY